MQSFPWPRVGFEINHWLLSVFFYTLHVMAIGLDVVVTCFKLVFINAEKFL